MVIAIIGILAAVGLPLYQGHTVMAKVSEVENAMSIIATGATNHYQNQNAWPNCPTINEVQNGLGEELSLGSLLYLFQTWMAKSLIG